ncbi:DUF1499 domain-containing protein [Agarivorans sp. Z349TD_8]|uniref:DUF1499 domain-containing protein n=1 Tax=Agarivorans sp. Z349TD_8 TaxID=3421434 RepID=UPI003D7CC9F3
MGHLAALASTPNGVSTEAQNESKKVAALPFKGDLKQTQLAALGALAKMGNNQVMLRNEVYVHTVFITAKLRFRDDVELYFDPRQQQVHFRSQSRVGYSDRGVNLARYRQFAKLYTEQE